MKTIQGYIFLLDLVTMQQKMITRDDLDGAVALLEIAFEDEKPARKPIGIRKSLFTRLFFSQKVNSWFSHIIIIRDPPMPGVIALFRLYSDSMTNF